MEDGDNLEVRSRVSATIAGLPAPVTSQEQTTIRRLLEKAARTPTVTLEGDDLSIAFEVSGLLTPASAEAIVWSAVLRSSAHVTAEVVKKINLQCTVTHTLPPEPPPPATPAPRALATAALMWIPAGVTLLTMIYLLAKVPSGGPAAAAPREQSVSPVEVHVSLDRKPQEPTSGDTLAILEQEARARVMSVMRCEAVKANPPGRSSPQGSVVAECHCPSEERHETTAKR